MNIKNVFRRLTGSVKYRTRSFQELFARRTRASRRRASGVQPCRVNLVAYIRAEMGLGTAARGLALAMEAGGVPFNVINFEDGNAALHRDTTWRHRETGGASTHDVTIVAINPDNIFNADLKVRKKLLKDSYTIAYWFWELPEIPDQWLPAFSLVDEVWAASRFVQDSISLKSPVPVFRVPVPIRLGATDGFSRESFQLPNRQFLFLSMSDAHSYLERKNPLGAVRAFQKAFTHDDTGVGLILKINNADGIHADREGMARVREEISGWQNIYLMERSITRAEIDSLLAVCDCYVSLHRAEGYGLGPAEAMSLGKPAILTNWSGNTDYMTPHNSAGINYRLIPVGKQYGPYHPSQLWADPDLEQAADWMRRLSRDAELASSIGRLARETISTAFSPESVGRLIRHRLKYIRETTLSR